MDIEIKNFGDNKQCCSIDELKSSLMDYKGKCVSIVSKSDRGIVKIYFVDVNKDGSIFNSYRPNVGAPFDFNQLNDPVPD
jgi:hypothetical protein